MGKEYIFTTCGNTSNSIPTQGQIDTEYNETELDGKVQCIGGIQKFATPTSGLYKIETYGASGGRQPQIYEVSKGTHMSGEFELYAGTNLLILVGQRGADNPTSDGGAGGGGGTFVVKEDCDSLHNMHNKAKVTPLIISGGGGGMGGDSGGHHALITESGNNGHTGLLGGINGNAGNSPSDNYGSGAGFLGENTDANRGHSFLNGGQGGNGGLKGGFGGGGGTLGGGNDGAGGGGGYSGGASSSESGGGGGSYNIGESQNNKVCDNVGEGKVVITLIKASDRYIIKDNDDDNYKYYNIDAEEWITLGNTLTTELLKSVERGSFSLNKLHLLNLTKNPDLIVYTEDNTTITSRNYVMNKIPYYQIITQVNDIDLSTRRLVLSKPTQTYDKVKYAVSVDSGVTWNAYKNNIWEEMTLTQSDYIAKGMTYDEFVNIKLNEWRKLNLEKIRFAFYFEVTELTNASITDFNIYSIDK